MDVAVVGAGPAGLAAAWTLAGEGARVTLYERRTEVGGRLRTDELDGIRVDAVVQLLASHYVETLRLAREVGAEGLLVRSPGRDAVWRGGRAHAITYGSVASMMVSGALPLGLKLRMGARYVPFLNRHARLLDASEPMRTAEAGLDRESVAAWGGRELGEDFTELMAYPLLAAQYAATPEEIGTGLFHALARAGMSVELYAVRGGMGELARAVQGALAGRGAGLRAGVEMTGFAVDGAGVEVRWSGGSARHDSAVLALPPAVLRDLEGIPARLAGWLEGVRVRPTASLALVLDRPAAAEYFGLTVPRTEPPGSRIAAVCVEGRKGARLVPKGKGLLVVYPAPSVAERASRASPAEVLDLLLPAVERVLPGVRSTVVRAKSYHVPDGGVLFYPGYGRHLAALDPAWLGERLALAGDYLVSPTVDGAVRSGRAAARRLLGDGSRGG